MKHMNRILALALALIMVLGLATTAYAADETYTLTLNDALEGHTYTAYQIFTGDLNESTLSNIVWGEGVTEAGRTALGDAAAKAVSLKTTAEAEKFADEVAKYLGTEAGSVIIAEGETTGKIPGLKPGYYLVRNTAVPVDGAYTDYILIVVKDTEANVKAEVPESDKEIKGDNNSIEGDIAADGESDNVSIGSKIEYNLTGKVPAVAPTYKYYYFIFNDTLSKGLTFNNDVIVWIDANNDGEIDEAEKLTADTDYKVYTETTKDKETNIKVAMQDAKSLAGKTINVTYTATLNEHAVIGEVEGNPNSLHIDFSNNPNFDYDGTEHPDKPGLPDEGKDVPTGKTPEDTVRTYTTGLKLIKVDENRNTLTGAEFKIEGDNLVEILTVETVNYKEDTNGDFWKLKDKTYTKTAPQTEDKMEEKTSRDSGYVKTDDADRDGYITVGGVGYATANAEELASSVTLYKLIKANSDQYASTETKYAIDTVTYTQKNAITGQTYTKVVGADGTLILAGLGEGTYTITETKTPAGYNSLTGPITVEIKWTAPNTEDGGVHDCEWEAAYTYGSVNGSLNMNAGGIFELEIVNQSGSTLPSTGGMGTTLFYAFGGLLMAAAVVMLVTKKRMASAK